MRITDVEVVPIRPPSHDFNNLTLQRYHGPAIQSLTVYVLHTDTGFEGVRETWGNRMYRAASRGR